MYLIEGPPVPDQPTVTTRIRLDTVVATVLRSILILAPLVLPLRLIFPRNWLNSPAFQSIIVRPHQTLDHIREAVAIQRLSLSTASTTAQSFVGAYHANQTIRLPPLALAAFSGLLEQENPELWMGFLLLLVDFCIAYLIESLGREILLSRSRPIDTYEEQLQKQLPTVIRPPNAHIFPISRLPNGELFEDEDGDNQNSNRSRGKSKPLLPLSELPILAAQLYYWSPFTAIAGGYFQCFQNLSCMFLLASLCESCRRPGVGKRPKSLSIAAMFLALASYLEPHHVVFVVPVSVWACQSPKSTMLQRKSIFALLVCYLFWIISLHVLSYSLVGGSLYHYWQILEASYGYGWYHLRPNLSVTWYFHMQLFPRFRDYFGILISGLPYLLVMPTTTRLHKYPMELVSIFWLLFTIFRPNQTLYDLNVGLCFLLLSPRSLARMSVVSSIALCSIWVPVLLYVLDYWMWLETGSGNANYMYFQCLAYNAFIGIVVGQFSSASVQRDKALRIMEKQIKKTTASTTTVAVPVY